MHSQKLRQYSFWAGLISAIVLLVEAVASMLGVQINTDAFVSVANTILGTLVVLGIITKDKTNTKDNTQDDK